MPCLTVRVRNMLAHTSLASTNTSDPRPPAYLLPWLLRCCHPDQPALTALTTVHSAVTPGSILSLAFAWAGEVR